MDRQTKIAIFIAIVVISLIIALGVFGYLSGRWEDINAI